jgi:hypothetical protein
LESINDDSSTPSAERLNYFNYFTEVEEEFVRRRGKHMLISTLDWALVESWKNAGIPLHIVLRAINQAFDAYDARGHKHRKVNTIFYCQQAVETTFSEYRLAQVGGAQPGEPSQQQDSEAARTQSPREQSPFAGAVVLDFLARCDDQLGEARSRSSAAGARELDDAIDRARARLKEIIVEIQSSARLDAESLERDLDAIDRMILEGAANSCAEDELKKIRAEAESQLRSYRKKMDKAIYEQTVQNFVSRRLREMNNIPRLSLFYL